MFLLQAQHFLWLNNVYLYNVVTYNRVGRYCMQVLLRYCFLRGGKSWIISSFVVKFSMFFLCIRFTFKQFDCECDKQLVFHLFSMVRLKICNYLLLPKCSNVGPYSKNNCLVKCWYMVEDYIYILEIIYYAKV